MLKDSEHTNNHSLQKLNKVVLINFQRGKSKLHWSYTRRKDMLHNSKYFTVPLLSSRKHKMFSQGYRFSLWGPKPWEEENHPPGPSKEVLLTVSHKIFCLLSWNYRPVIHFPPIQGNAVLQFWRRHVLKVRCGRCISFCMSVLALWM